jgi:hypothetical protein
MGSVEKRKQIKRKKITMLKKQKCMLKYYSCKMMPVSVKIHVKLTYRSMYEQVKNHINFKAVYIIGFYLAKNKTQTRLWYTYA